MSKLNEKELLEELDKAVGIKTVAYQQIRELIKIFFAKEISTGPIKKDFSRPELIEWLQGLNQAATSQKDYVVMKITTQLIEMLRNYDMVQEYLNGAKSGIGGTKEFIEEKAKQLYTEVGIQYREILRKGNIEDFIRRLLEEAQGMGEDWLPTPENINALPEPVRKYIADLETNADPASMVQENALLRDTCKALEIKLEEKAVQLPEITEAWTDAKAKEIKALIKNAQDEDLSDPVMSLHYLGLSLDIVTSIINDLRPR